MARLDFGVEVGMERFGAVHTGTDRDAVIISIMGDARQSTAWNFVDGTRSLTRKPIARNRSLRSLGNKLAVDDGTAGRKLHRKPGVVLIVDDRARIRAQLRLAGDEIAERVDVLAPYQTLLDRLQ